MNKIFALFALASCATGTSYPPDSPDGRLEYEHDARAFDASIDALQPDAATPHTEGCNMGLLPAARTTTLVNGDPISPDLINEIEDMIVGNKRATYGRTFYPRFVIVGSWSAVAVIVTAGGFAHPGFTSTAGSVLSVVEIPYIVGERITSLDLKVCGNGAADLSADVAYASTYLATDVSISIPTLIVDSNRTAAWATFSIPVTPTILTAGSSLTLQFFADQAGYTIGHITANFDRL